jgi:glutamine synthetase
MIHFFTNLKGRKGAIERFNGGMLIQQDQIASSFTNGRMRINTFVARGYTAWDPILPAFYYGNYLYSSFYISYMVKN